MSRSITTEKLRKKFKNNFDLCNFAILIGRDDISHHVQTSLESILDTVERKADDANKLKKSE